MQIPAFLDSIQSKWSVEILGEKLIKINGDIKTATIQIVSTNQVFTNYRLNELEPSLENDTIYLREELLETKNAQIIQRISAKIDALTPVFARKTKCIPINEKLATEFLNENHLLGFSGKHFYGLYLKDELMAVATFSNPRNLFRRKEPVLSYELEKFAIKGGFHIIGGLSKLLNQFEKDFKAQHIMTYADLDWGWGFGFQAVGFTFQGIKIFDVGKQIASAKWILTR